MPAELAKPNQSRRWLILGVLSLAQLMVVLDATVVNIALPSAQQALHFSVGDRQWVVTAYALAFGSLLLLGGRISDVFGRKRTLIIGLGGFAIASAAGGAATSFIMLIAARGLQGAFGALLAPAALSLLTTTFTEPGERGTSKPRRRMDPPSGSVRPRPAASGSATSRSSTGRGAARCRRCAM